MLTPALPKESPSRSSGHPATTSDAIAVANPTRCRIAFPPAEERSSYSAPGSSHTRGEAGVTTLPPLTRPFRNRGESWGLMQPAVWFFGAGVVFGLVHEHRVGGFLLG